LATRNRSVVHRNAGPKQLVAWRVGSDERLGEITKRIRVKHDRAGASNAQAALMSHFI